NFGYNLSRTLEEIRPTFTFDETCQHTVPEAIICYLEGKDYEDVIRLAITLAGDADTLAAIAGSIASAVKDVSTEVTQRVISLLSDEFCTTLLRFNELVAKREIEAQ
ncbi:MAG: ADP-ribosylglycohydrolase family protein, partial [Muribaculaceae bacterium]|nr:ADP-ribosylglycohydrolase family protein [Muribaculaceae bacterium]